MFGFARLLARAFAGASRDLAKEAGTPPVTPPPAPEPPKPEPPKPEPEKPQPKGPRRCNEAGIALIKSFESCRLEAYDDGVGVMTIGWGHTKGVKKGDRISQGEADELFLEDLEEFEKGVDKLLGQTPTHENEFAAMVSLAFNIGLSAFARSTLLKRHRQGNKIGAANAFLMWRFAGGRELRGLVRRREAERRLYLS